MDTETGAGQDTQAGTISTGQRAQAAHNAETIGCPALTAIYNRLSCVPGLRSVADTHFIMLAPDDLNPCPPADRMAVFLGAGFEIGRLCLKHAGLEGRGRLETAHWFGVGFDMFTRQRAHLNEEERRSLRGAFTRAYKDKQIEDRAVLWLVVAADDILLDAQGLRPVDPNDLTALQAPKAGTAGATSLATAIVNAWEASDGALRPYVRAHVDKAMVEAIALGTVAS